MYIALIHKFTNIQCMDSMDDYDCVFCFLLADFDPARNVPPSTPQRIGESVPVIEPTIEPQPSASEAPPVSRTVPHRTGRTIFSSF